MAASAIFFCIAISVLFICVRQYRSALYAADSILLEEIIVQTADDNGQSMDQGDVIAALMGALEYDVEINGYLISKTLHQETMIADYPIPDGYYKKTYQYDSKGTLIRICYTSR